MTSQARVLTSLECAAVAAGDTDAADDDGDSSLSTVTSSCLVLLPGSLVAAANGSRTLW